jgi:hypothetical protein
MCTEGAPEEWPEQWRRLVEGDAKMGPWGEYIPSRPQMNGLSSSKLREWANCLKGKVSNWIGKIPDSQKDNDGFWEVRVFWAAKRAEYLLQVADSMEKGEAEPPRRIVHPMPRPTHLPYQARAALCTKKEQEAMASGKEEDGSGGIAAPEDNVELPSPSAASRRPFKPPRKRAKLENDNDVFVPGTPQFDCSEDPLSSSIEE